LNSVLGAGEKTREDHRQHAIDAVVTALTTPAAIKRLSDAAARAPEAHRRRFAPVEPPWPGFLEAVRDSIDTMVVSHRAGRKVAAALHEETNYSKPQTDDDGKPCVHVRKPLESLSTSDVDSIADPAVRRSVEQKLGELGESNPQKAFREKANHPTLQAADGRAIPIHKVRIAVPVTPQTIGRDARTRHVKLGSNHHVEIVETTDKRGRTRWEGVVVSTYEAMRRLKARTPVVQRDHGPGKRFLFSLCGGDTIELDAEQEKKELYVVRTISLKKTGRVTVDFVGIKDARKKSDIQVAGAWGSSDIDPLRKRNCRKVIVMLLGEVRRAGD